VSWKKTWAGRPCHGGALLTNPTQPDLIWFNGEVIPFADARINVEDRGYQFADGVYEVCRFYDGKPFTLKEHMDRLARSAGGLKIALPMAVERVGEEMTRFIPRTGLREG